MINARGRVVGIAWGSGKTVCATSAAVFSRLWPELFSRPGEECCRQGGVVPGYICPRCGKCHPLPQYARQPQRQQPRTYTQPSRPRTYLEPKESRGPSVSVQIGGYDDGLPPAPPMPDPPAIPDDKPAMSWAEENGGAPDVPIEVPEEPEGSPFKAEAVRSLPLQTGTVDPDSGKIKLEPGEVAYQPVYKDGSKGKPVVMPDPKWHPQIGYNLRSIGNLAKMQGKTNYHVRWHCQRLNSLDERVAALAAADPYGEIEDALAAMDADYRARIKAVEAKAQAALDCCQQQPAPTPTPAKPAHLVLVRDLDADYWPRMSTELRRAQGYFSSIGVVDPPENLAVPLPQLVGYQGGVAVLKYVGVREVSDALSKISRGEFSFPQSEGGK